MLRFTTALGSLLLVSLTPASLAAETAPAAITIVTSEDAKLTAFLDAEFTKALVLEPELATSLGKKGFDRWEDISPRGEARQVAFMQGSVARMTARFDRDRLSAAGKINYDLWESRAERAALSARFRTWRPPLYSYLRPEHTGAANFLMSTHTVADAADMRGWIARVRTMPVRLEQALAWTQASDKAGVRLPRYQTERVRDSARSLVTGAPFGGNGDAPLWADAQKKIAALETGGKITAAQATTFRADARTAILGTAKSLNRIADWADKAAPTAPSGKVGAASLPDGARFYAAALELATTTTMSAAEIHRIGQSEILRIAAEQDALAKQAGFADRAAYYADRAKRYPAVPFTDATRAQYLADSNAVIAKAITRLPERFNMTMAYPVEVNREPAFSEIPGGAAHASFPAADGSRPGYVFVHLSGNTLDPGKLAALMCHEGVPGHVFQGDIAVRQTGVPEFRRAAFYGAYAEGWALYAESLCNEMGVYADVADKFMALDREIYRSVRLVVDTGIHDLGWSEDEAVAYMVETGRLPEQQARAEVRRYITMPGQATSYKVGMIKIEELRARAEAALGAKFDVRAFNDLVVGGGGMPLSLLERRVDEWIAAQR